MLQVGAVHLYNWTAHITITISLCNSMVDFSHLYHEVINMFVKSLKTWVFVALLFTIHCAPSSGDTESFHRALANYSSQKHLGDTQNLTRGDDVQPTQATWPAPTPSEGFLL